MLFPTIMASAALFTMGIANPMPADVLAKPGEGIHLAVCENTQSTAIVPRSFVIYCANDNNCQLDDPYNSDNAVIVGDPSFNWEGAGYTATFRTGVRFHFHIDADAKSKPNYTPVDDTAGNDYRSWTGYKDDGHSFINSKSWQCISKYYYI